MDANEVLRQFLSLCNENNGFLQYHLIPNSVLEWFGKTIRGPHRIHSFYRYDLSQQYEQQFESVQQCEPFEIKPSHFQTKKILPSEKKVVPKNLLFEKSEMLEISSLLNLKTPEQEPKFPVLPALKQGRMFIDDDHDELTELGLSEISKTVVSLPSSSCKSNEPLEKKMKMTTITKDKTTDSQTNAKEYNLMDDLMDQDDLSNSSSNDHDCKYSNLMYLEAFGKLQVANKQQKYSSNKNGYNESGLYDSPLSNCKVHLKLSYRIDRISNELQFALIIYENIKQNSTIRRNLLMEFGEVEDVENVQKFKIENKRKKPVKMALRL